MRGRVALVTGGGWNLGRAVALALAADGARVAVAGRRKERLVETVRRIEAAGGVGLAVPGDVSRPDDVAAIVAETQRAFGPIGALAALAGGGNVDAPLDEIAPAALQQIVGVNLLGPLLCARAVLPDLRRAGRGTILVAIGGGAAFPQLGVHVVAYAAAKAGLARMVDQLTAELLDTGIRVNAIEPGVVWDDEVRALVAVEERRTGRHHPLREHAASPAEAVRLATWLLGEGSAPLRGRLVAVGEDWWHSAEGIARVDASVGACRLRRQPPP